MRQARGAIRNPAQVFEHSAKNSGNNFQTFYLQPAKMANMKKLEHILEIDITAVDGAVEATYLLLRLNAMIDAHNALINLIYPEAPAEKDALKLGSDTLA